MLRAALQRFRRAAEFKLHEEFKGQLVPLEQYATMLDMMEKIGSERKIDLR